jgi:hypothetical protein
MCIEGYVVRPSSRKTHFWENNHMQWIENTVLKELRDAQKNTCIEGCIVLTGSRKTQFFPGGFTYEQITGRGEGQCIDKRLQTAQPAYQVMHKGSADKVSCASRLKSLIAAGEYVLRHY